MAWLTPNGRRSMDEDLPLLSEFSTSAGLSAWREVRDQHARGTASTNVAIAIPPGSMTYASEPVIVAARGESHSVARATAVAQTDASPFPELFCGVQLVQAERQ